MAWLKGNSMNHRTGRPSKLKMKPSQCLPTTLSSSKTPQDMTIRHSSEADPSATMSTSLKSTVAALPASMLSTPPNSVIRSRTLTTQHVQVSIWCRPIMLASTPLPGPALTVNVTLDPNASTTCPSRARESMAKVPTVAMDLSLTPTYHFLSRALSSRPRITRLSGRWELPSPRTAD